MSRRRRSLAWSFAPISVGWTRRFPFAGAEAFAITAALILITFLTPTNAPAAPPANFTDTSVVTGLGGPTDIAFLPNGQMLITTQGGTLYASTGSDKTVSYTIPAICSDFERGLLGVTVDPSFNSNSYIYLFYTFNKHGSCASNSSSSPVNRVSRFTFNTTTNTVDGGSETVLVDNMPSPNGNHNAGDLAFGKDGYLYISIGDGGCDLDNASLCAGQNSNARKENILTGKILRITRTGGIPPTNPFQGAGTAVCAINGRTGLDRCRETFAWGLRNPFRFAFDPNAAGTRFYINDVGQGTWEEIDEGIAGADYGWNVREGHCARGSTSNCGTPPAGMTNPIYDYQHGACNSITAGAFVPNGIWPATYDGAYLFADYTCGRIWRLNGSSRVDFATGPGVISMQFGPSGSTQALYYTTYDNGGEVRKILYTGQANRPPIADAGADKTFGTLPLTVAFDGRGSTDPDGDALTYVWDFGDGSENGTGATPQHTYTTAAKRTVTLTVTDGRGGTGTDTLTIDAGNTQPQPTISSPTSSALFNVGQQVTLQGSAIDAEDGTLPASSLTWSVILHHDTHTHPFLTNVSGNNIRFTAPAPEDLAAAATSYLEIQLTATDSNGLSKTITQDFQPRKVNLTFATDPSGLAVEVEGVELTGSETVTTWASWQIQVDVPSPQVDGAGQSRTFASWSDGGAKAHTITTPSSPQTYTATFQLASGPTFAPVADARVREAGPNSNYGTSTTLEVDGGTDRDVETYFRFDVSGVGGIGKAELWVYIVSGSVDGPAVYSAGNNWTETGITWSNRPARTTTPIDDKGALPNRAWVVYDVTPLVAGNGTYTFVLATTSTDGITAYSRQASSHRPKLVIIPGSGSGDTTAPSVPQNLNATSPVYNRVDLSWNASTDNVGVTGYDIFRDGEFLTSLGPQTTYADTTVAASTEYDYQVRARDAAGNVSSLSTVKSVTTVNRVRTFSPVADARVQENRPTTRYGSSTQLRAEGGSDPDIDSYLRFNVSGVSGRVVKATLRVFVPSGSGYGTVDGPAVFTASNSWSESTITWNNRPPRSTTPRDDKGKLPAGAWVEYDVTPLVAGDATYTFVLASTSTDYVTFSSREGANPPQLAVEYNPNAAALAAEVDEVPSPTPAPTALPSPAPGDAPTERAPANLPFTDDFESGTFNRWSNSSGMSVQSEVTAGGAWAARAVTIGTPDAPGASASAVHVLAEPVDELYARTRFNVLSRGDNPATLMTLESRSGRPLISALVTSAGNLAILPDRSRVPIELSTVAPDRWHELQIHVRLDGNRGLVEVWYDDDLIFSQSVRLGSSEIDAVRIGDTATDRTFDVAFDDVAIDTTCVGACSTALVEPTPTPSAPANDPADRRRPTPEPSPTAEIDTPTATPEPPPPESTASAPAEPTPDEQNVESR